MKLRPCTSPLSRIDSTDDAYRITTCEDNDVLAASISAAGLLNPPVLRDHGDSYTIVSGFRRIAACRSLGWSEIDIRLVEACCDDLTCCTIAIVDNALQRPLNLIETSRAINMLSSFFPGMAGLSENSARLGLPDSPAILNKLRRLCLLPMPLQEGVLANSISLAMAMELDRLEPSAAIGFTALFDSLGLSLSRQRETISLVKEIARRENLTIVQTLASADLQDILRDEDLDRTQKQRRLRRHLRGRRFPNLTRAERQFEDGVQALGLRAGTRLIAPSNFEGEAYILQMRFRDTDELRSRKYELESIIEHPGLQDLLER